MKKSFTRVLSLLLLAVMMTTCFSGCGKAWPAKAVEFVSPFSAGGGNDIFTRTAAQGLTEVAKFPVAINVVNKTGGAGEVGQQYAKGSKDEYHVMSLVTGDIYGWKQRTTDLTIDDYKPIAILGADLYFLLVAADAPYNSIEEFIEYSKSNPGMTMSGSGYGGLDWLGWNLLCSEGLQAEYVPYEGAGEATAAVVAKQISAVWQTPATALTQIQAGTLKALAVSSEKRVEWEGLEDVPCAAELGRPNLVFSQWRGFVAPKSMSDESVAKLIEYFKTLYNDSWWKENYLDKYKLIPVFAAGNDMYEMMKATDAEATRIAELTK